MRAGDNVRLRTDGRYEAIYIKSRDELGKPIYGYCYGATEEEAREKKDYQLNKTQKRKEMNLLILGAGDHGRDVRDLAKSFRIFNKIDFLDDNLCEKEAIGHWRETKKLLNDYPIAIVAVADEETRKNG